MAHSSTLRLLSLSVFSPSSIPQLFYPSPSSIPPLYLSHPSPSSISLPPLSLYSPYPSSIPILSLHLSPVISLPSFFLPLSLCLISLPLFLALLSLSLLSFFVSSAMLEVSSSLSPSMVRFCTGELSVDCLASLAAQNLDYILALAATLPPPPCIPPKSFNGECPPSPHILLFIQSPITCGWTLILKHFRM